MVIFVAPVSHCVELALFSVDFSGKLPKYVAADLRLHSIHPSITRESKGGGDRHRHTSGAFPKNRQ